MSIIRNLKTWLLLGVVSVLGTVAVFGSTVNYAVTLNTTSLEGQGQFSLAFQLASGTGLDNGNNTVKLYNFSFGGGSTAGSTADLNGGATGNFSSGVSITDTAFFNEMDQSFAPGSTVSFWITLSNNGNTGASQDLFTMSLLSGSGFGIPTTDPSGNDTLLTITLNGSVTPPIGTWGTDTSMTTYNVSAPNLASIPEPGSLTLLAGGLFGVLLLCAAKSRRWKLWSRNGAPNEGPWQIAFQLKESIKMSRDAASAKARKSRSRVKSGIPASMQL